MDDRLTLIWAIRSKLVAGQQMQPHTHTCHQLYYILSGTPHFIIGGQLVLPKPGDFFVIPAGVPHQVLELGKDGMESFELKVVLTDPFLIEHLQTFHQPLEDQGTIYQTLLYIVKYWTCQDSQNLQDIHCLLSSMLLQLFLSDLHYKDIGSRYIKTDRYNVTTRLILSYFLSIQSFSQLIYVLNGSFFNCQCFQQRVTFSDTHGSADLFGNNNATEVVNTAHNSSSFHSFKPFR